MTVAYNNTLRLADLATGTEVGTWGELTDTNICSLLTQAVAGVTNITLANNANDYILSALNGQLDEARSAVLGFGGTLTVTKNIIIPNSVKLYHVFNWTSGGGTIILKPTAGTGVAVPTGSSAIVYCDGYNTASFLASALNNYVPKTGAIMTGQLILQDNQLVLRSTNAGLQTGLVLQSYPGNQSVIYFGYATGARWLMVSDNAAETGGNAGTNFQLAALKDDGSWNGTIFYCDRATRNTSFSPSVWFNSAVTTAGKTTLNGELAANSNITVGGNTTIQNLWINGTIYGRNDGIIYLGHDTHFYGNIQVDGTINGSHNINMAGDAHVGAVFAPNGLFVGTTTDFGVFAGPNNRYVQHAGSWHWNWQNADGLIYWNRYGVVLWVMRPSDNLCYNSASSVGGNGGYLNFSDRRGKVNVATSQRGLDAILQLQPVEFSRILPPPDKFTRAMPERRELGFVAQDLLGIIPEAVATVGVTLPDGTGGLDSGNPSLAVDSDAIIAAMVNAIKTLTARIAGLEARLGG